MPLERGAILDRIRDVIVVVMLIIVIYSAYQARQDRAHLRSVVECQAAYNKASATVSRQRAIWADQDRDALQQLLVTTIGDNDPVAVTDKALATYQAITKRNATNRRETPMPANNCGNG